MLRDFVTTIFFSNDLVKSKFTKTVKVQQKFKPTFESEPKK